MTLSIPIPIPIPIPKGTAKEPGAIVICHRDAASSHHHNHQGTKTRRSHEEAIGIGRRPIVVIPLCFLCVFVSLWLRRFPAERRTLEPTASGVRL